MFLRLFLISPLFFYLFHLALSENPMLMRKKNSDQIEKISECVLKLSSKYFVEKKALSGSIVIININSYLSTTQKLLLKTIHDGTKYSIMVKDSLYPHANASHFPEKAKNYMMILEEKSELSRNILQLNKLPTWNPLAKAIVYYEMKKNEDSENVAMKIINELREHKLLYTIVLLYSPMKREIVSYTWSPYNEFNCGGPCNSVYILDRCENGMVTQTHEQKELFPTNMKGCPLIVYAVVAEPYVMQPVSKILNTNFNDTYIFKSGAEIQLVNIISHFMNTSLITRSSNRSEDWGYVYSNGTATGAFDVLRKDSADLLVGNIEVTRTIRKWFFSTVIYDQDDMTWCVPKAGEAATWDNLVIIFQWTTWVATFMSLIIMGTLFHYCYYQEQDKKKLTKWPTYSLLMALSILLGWGALFQAKRTSFRILLIVWLCFSLIMGISYESFLRSFLMYPRFQKQISTEMDIIESGIPLGGRVTYRSYFKTNNVSSFYLYHKYNSTPFIEGIKRVALDRNFAVVASRRQAKFQDQKLGKTDSLIYCFPESDNLYKYGVVLLARKWFPMMDRLNDIIRSVSENGLINKWKKEMFKNKINSEGAANIVPLGLQHLVGVFMFVGIMYAVCIVIFLGELSVAYFR